MADRAGFDRAQYGFFDDTGSGSFAYTGLATVEQCLENLFNKVSLFGFTDRFEEFYILFGYLFRYPNISVAPENDTASLNDESAELKLSLTESETKKLESSMPATFGFSIKRNKNMSAAQRILVFKRSYAKP